MNPDLALLRELRARRPEEPVPMVLLLRDEREGTAPAAPLPGGGGGGALAERLDGLATSLAPTRRPDDLGVVETLLQVLAYEDFETGAR